MKKILFILSLFISVASFGQDTLIGKGGKKLIDTASLFSPYRTAINKNTDSLAIKLAVRDSAYGGYLKYSKYKPINIFYGDSIIFFGDSYTLSDQATNSSYGYVATLNNSTGTSAKNLAVSGRGGYTAATAAYTAANVLTQNNTNPSLYMAVLNDARRNGSSVTFNPKTFEKIKSCLRATIANNMLATAVAANNASVTAGGTWTTTSGIGDKASLGLGGLVRTSTVSGSTLTYTFTGNNVVIGCFGTATTGGTWSYSIDAGIYTGSYDPKGKADSISDGSNNNAIVPNAVVVTGLGSGSHTLIITTNENVPTLIDYIGTLQAVQVTNPFIVPSVPKMVASGYATLNRSTALWNQVDSVLQEVINEYKNYPVYYVDINQFYNLSNL